VTRSPEGGRAFLVRACLPGELLQRALRLAIDCGQHLKKVCKKVAIFEGEQHRTRYLFLMRRTRLMSGAIPISGIW
jgi:hypothetical protein